MMTRLEKPVHLDTGLECPKCSSTDVIRLMEVDPDSTPNAARYVCNDCRRQFRAFYGLMVWATELIPYQGGKKDQLQRSRGEKATRTKGKCPACKIGQLEDGGQIYRDCNNCDAAFKGGERI